MTIEMITSLLIFAFIGTATPGPNNIMLLASGMNYGYLRTIPHMVGIGLGFPVMVMLIGLGLAELFDQFPWSYTALKIISTLYLLYLAWKIATAGRPKLKDGEEALPEGQPVTILQAVAFQWVNPKAWAMALTTISLFTPKAADGSSAHTLASVAIIAAAFLLVSIPTANLWTLLGYKLRQWMKDETKRRVFNITCAILLVASLYPILTS